MVRICVALVAFAVLARLPVGLDVGFQFDAALAVIWAFGLLEPRPAHRLRRPDLAVPGDVRGGWRVRGRHDGRRAFHVDYLLADRRRRGWPRSLLGRAGRPARPAPARHHAGDRHARHRAGLRPVRLPGPRLRMVHRRHRRMARRRRDASSGCRSTHRSTCWPLTSCCSRCSAWSRLLMVNLHESGAGRRFRAIRDSELAAATMGVNLTRYKLLAFGMSAGDRRPRRLVLPAGRRLGQPAALLGLHVAAVRRHRAC